MKKWKGALVRFELLAEALGYEMDKPEPPVAVTPLEIMGKHGANLEKTLKDIMEGKRPMGCIR